MTLTKDDSRTIIWQYPALPLEQPINIELLQVDGSIEKKYTFTLGQILKDQEIAKFLKGRESIMTYEKEAEEAKQIVKSLKKRIGELEDFRDNTPQYEGSGTVEVNKRLLIQLQEILRGKK